MKKVYIALALAVLAAGLVAAHETGIEDVDEDGWHISHMIAHHGSLQQWEEDHEGLDWDDHHQETTLTGWRGCH